MPEREAFVRTVRVRLFCPHDDEEMKRLPGALLTNPPQYDYECRTCGYRERSRMAFPYLKYIEYEPG